MAKAPRRWSLTAVALAAAACSSPDPWDQPPRFVVLPFERASVDGPLHAGVAWIPAGEGTAVTLTDVAPVPELSVDFAWAPEGPPPETALRACADIDCIEQERAAVGWLVAFRDLDGDGGAVVRLPEGDAWSPADLVAEGDDLLEALATDHVLAWAAGDLAPGGGLARALGWPLVAGASVMQTRVEDGRDRLSPTVTRERVRLYLLGHRDGSDELGLCCAAAECGHPDVHCPSFQGR